jgi:GNAT superfamily N-acetyltransferase
MQIRDLRDDETPFLRDMLFTALAWRPSRRLPPKAVPLRLPQVSMFHKGWGRPADTALADDDGRPIGLAWYRFFTEAVHGEGFVDEQTPELAIAVVDGHRGSGVGTALMEAIHVRARDQGVARISLRVDHDNPAKRWYEPLGYVEFPPGHEDGRMLLELA